ncbi:MAG: DUF427 domain-containing protein [Pirellulaceae bacterium]|nr:DUF427 domain-containing protein [Pirellulaceae bacterium]
MKNKRVQPTSQQESVWDYPRPPRLEQSESTIVVEAFGIQVARSTKTKRVLETSHPPVHYIPPEDLDMKIMIPSQRRSWCEWKGEARFYDLSFEQKTIEDAAWYYPSPVRRFAELAGHVAFYPTKMAGCWVDGEKVIPQEGDFYGGWITSKIVGPFKGAPGTLGW